MSTPAKLLLTACLAFIIAGAGFEVASAAESGPAVQDLIAPKASGKVNAVYWTRQEDSYALQLLIPPFIGNTISCIRGLDPTFGARLSTRSNGQQQTLPGNPVTSITEEEIVYRFPLTQSEQAVAAAFRIDDDYYIEKLQPLLASPNGQ